MSYTLLVNHVRNNRGTGTAGPNLALGEDRRQEERWQ